MRKGLLLGFLALHLTLTGSSPATPTAAQTPASAAPTLRLRGGGQVATASASPGMAAKKLIAIDIVSDTI
jgi:hypothetical protein